MEEATVEYILTDEAQSMRQQMIEIQNKPLATQRYLHFTDALKQMSYVARIVSKKEDRISLIERSYAFRYGTNGVFMKSDRVSGMTYYYKGRASQRLRIWSGNKFKNFRERDGQNPLLQEMALLLDSPGKHLFDLPIIQSINTNGMLGYIMAGNITTTTEAMQYYIRYSLRGSGVSQDKAENLYEYLSQIDNNFTAICALRVAVNPNSVLEQFHPHDLIFDGNRLVKSIGHGQNLIRIAQATGEKIDWADPHFNVETEVKRLSRKEKGIKEFLQLWEGGPVLKSKARSVNPIDMVVLTDDGLPF